MITIQELIRMLKLHHNLVKMQTDGLTHADTLIQPQPSGNCMNWVLGHLLEYQVSLLTILGKESPVDPSELSAYQTDSTPIKSDGPGVLPLDRLLEYHDRVHEKVIAGLSELNEADFSREIQFQGRTVTLGWRVFFFVFHSSYHLGQLELLRQLAGKTEKVL